MKEALATAKELTGLYEEALALKGCSPQSFIKENQMVVVQDPETDMLGYCVIQPKGEGFELNVHLGNDGLKSYLNGFVLKSDTAQIMDKNCLQLSFCPSAELENKDFSQIEKLDINLKSIGKLPKFRHFTTGYLPENIRTGWHTRFLTQVLKQLIQLSNDMRTGVEDLNTIHDESILCTFTPQGWKRLKVPMKVFLDQVDDNPILYGNDLEAYRINRLPMMNMTFEITQFFIPTPVKKTRLSRGFYPLVTAAFEKSTNQIVFAEITECSRENMEEVVSKFAKTLLVDLQFKPKYLITDSETVMEIFKDFCQKTKMTVELVPALDTIKEFVGELMGIKDEEELTAITSSSGFEDEIDGVLETARSICQTILNSSLLNNKISDLGRHQFTSIIELLHVVMMSNFKELPDAWTVSNVDQALQSIFPNLLTDEEMQLVPEIIYQFVDIVGEAQMLPNYFEIKARLEEMYYPAAKKQGSVS